MNRKGGVSQAGGRCLLFTYLGHLFPVRLGIERRFGEQNGMLLGRDAEFVVEGVMPDLLHVVPVGDDSVLDGILEREDTALALRLVADVRVLLSHADHDALVTRSSDDRWKDGTWRVIAGETGFAHAGAVVHNESSNFVVTHCRLRFERE